MESASSSVRSPDTMGPTRNSSGVRVRYLVVGNIQFCCVLLHLTHLTKY